MGAKRTTEISEREQRERGGGKEGKLGERWENMGGGEHGGRGKGVGRRGRLCKRLRGRGL